MNKNLHAIIDWFDLTRRRLTYVSSKADNNKIMMANKRLDENMNLFYVKSKIYIKICIEVNLE